MEIKYVGNPTLERIAKALPVLEARILTKDIMRQLNFKSEAPELFVRKMIVAPETYGCIFQADRITNSQITKSNVVSNFLDRAPNSAYLWTEASTLAAYDTSTLPDRVYSLPVIFSWRSDWRFGRFYARYCKKLLYNGLQMPSMETQSARIVNAMVLTEINATLEAGQAIDQGVNKERGASEAAA